MSQARRRRELDSLDVHVGNTPEKTVNAAGMNCRLSRIRRTGRLFIFQSILNTGLFQIRVACGGRQDRGTGVQELMPDSFLGSISSWP